MSFLADLQLPPFVVSVLQATLWLAILSAIFIPLEWLFAVRPAKILRREVAIDLCYYFINSVLPGIVLAVPLALVVIVSRKVIPDAALAAVVAWPIGLKMAVAMLVAEIGFYWGHRWSHEWPILWRFHAVHHSPDHVDFLVNSRAHPVDMVFTRLCGLAPLYAVGLSNTGAALENVVLVTVVTVYSMAWGFFIHANLRWRFGPLEWLIATPAFHRWHHSKLDHPNHNYAPTFPWLDRLFGSYYLPKGEWPAEYGITEPMEPTLIGQLAHPWRDEETVAPRAGGPTAPS